jgi:hypothetical protein
MAIYQCDWRWHPGAAARDAQERDRTFAAVFRAAETAGQIGEERLLGWYTYPGQSAGFLLVDAASHEDLAQLLRLYMELMTFDVKPVVRVDYAQARQRLIGAAGTR